MSLWGVGLCGGTYRQFRCCFDVSPRPRCDTKTVAIELGVLQAPDKDFVMLEVNQGTESSGGSGFGFYKSNVRQFGKT